MLLTCILHCYRVMRLLFCFISCMAILNCESKCISTWLGCWISVLSSFVSNSCLLLFRLEDFMLCMSLQFRSGEEKCGGSIYFGGLLNWIELKWLWRRLLLGGLVPTMAAVLLLMIWYFPNWCWFFKHMSVLFLDRKITLCNCDTLLVSGDWDLYWC